MYREIKETLKKIVFRYTDLGNPIYPYNIEPIQLTKLINLLDELEDIEGNFAEIGVARGQTTLFIATHLSENKYFLKNKDFKYYAIDTFSSFLKKDLDFEVDKRGKNLKELKGFNYNNFEKWKTIFKIFEFIKPIKADCSTFDYKSIAPLKLVLIDVDLYLPTKKALEKIFKHLVRGGFILVDDVLDNKNYDGAYHAYMEFCSENSLSPTIVGNKCGLIAKV